MRIAQQRLQLVTQDNHLLGIAVRFCEAFGLIYELLNLIWRQAGGGSDAHLVLATGCLVLRRHRNNAVRIDLEGNVDLRYTPRAGRNAHQLKFPERPIALGNFSLALQNVNLDGSLIIHNRRKRQAVA